MHWDAKKTTAENGLQLDMSKLARVIDFGRVVGRTRCSFNWQWTRSTLFGGESKNTVTLVCLPGFVEFHYSQDGADVTPYRAGVLQTTPNFGGVRYWWGCPRCGRRVRILYGAPFMCRECHALTYETRQKSRPYALVEAMHNRMYAIRRKVGDGGGLLDSLPEKPKTMHWETYERLSEEYRMLEAASICAMGLALQGKGRLGFDLPGVDDETVMMIWGASKRERKPHKRAPTGDGGMPIDWAQSRRLWAAEEERKRRRAENRLTLGELARLAGVGYAFARECEREGLLRADQGRTTRRRRYRRKSAGWLGKLAGLRADGWEWAELRDWTARRWQPGHEHERANPVR